MNEPTCGDCGKELTLVRPGKHQCDNPNCVQNNSKPESVPSCGEKSEDVSKGAEEILKKHFDEDWPEDMGVHGTLEEWEAFKESQPVFINSMILAM